MHSIANFRDVKTAHDVKSKVDFDFGGTTEMATYRLFYTCMPPAFDVADHYSVSVQFSEHDNLNIQINNNRSA